MEEKEAFKNSTKAFSDMAEISVNEATRILLLVMKEYKIDYRDLDKLINKFNEIEN